MLAIMDDVLTFTENAAIGALYPHFVIYRELATAKVLDSTQNALIKNVTGVWRYAVPAAQEVYCRVHPM